MDMEANRRPPIEGPMGGSAGQRGTKRSVGLSEGAGYKGRAIDL
jgi:hypothetical protein